VGNSLNAVDNGASKVVCRVDLVLGASAGVWLGFTAVDGRVAHTAVQRLHVNLSANSTLGAELCPILHLVPPGQVFLHAVVSVSGFRLRFTFHLHSLGIRVVHVGLALLEQLLSIAEDGVEMIRRPGEVVVLDLQHLKVLQDHLLVLLLLLGRVRVVEPHNKFSVERLLVVVVEQRRLGVAHVEVAAGLWREPHHDLPHLGARKVDELPAGALLLLGSRGIRRRCGHRSSLARNRLHDGGDLLARRHHAVPAAQVGGSSSWGGAGEKPQPDGRLHQRPIHTVVG